MAGKDSETTPLLSPEVSRFDQHGDIVTFLYLMRTTWSYHWISICASTLSCIVCTREGYAEYGIFDSLIFKSIFVVFGFAIGFRNVRGNARRAEALTSVRGMIHIVWDILVMIPDESRARVQEQLLDACAAIAEHVTIVAQRRSFHFTLAGLEPIAENGGDKETGLRMGPNAFVAATLLACEDEIDRLSKENPQTQKYRRTFWMKKQAFDKDYATVCNLAIPSVSDGYVMLINFCLFLFAVVLPWGLRCNEITIRGWRLISAGTFLLMNTMVVLMILFGLNTQASEHEDPFKESHEKIDIKSIFEVFATAMREYDARRRAASANKDDLVSLHKLLREDDKRKGQPLVRAITEKTL